MAARKTRGPRTPGERATDAARSTATRFEKLPPSHFADEYLKPIATLLRYVTDTGFLEEGPRLRDVRQWEQVESQVLDVALMFERQAEFMPLKDALRVERTMEKIRRELRQAKGRMAAALAEGNENL